MSDAELLVASVNDGDRFAALYERHARAVLAFFVHRTGCAQTAADLTAETFAEAFTSRHRFRDIGAPGRAWLFTVADRQLRRFIRRENVATRARRRLGVAPVVLSTAELDAVERLVDLGPLRRQLDAAMADLPAAQADAVRLRIGSELPYVEVARRLGCSEAAARVRVCRGLSRLSALMEGRP